MKIYGSRVQNCRRKGYLSKKEKKRIVDERVRVQNWLGFKIGQGLMCFYDYLIEKLGVCVWEGGGGVCLCLCVCINTTHTPIQNHPPYVQGEGGAKTIGISHIFCTNISQEIKGRIQSFCYHDIKEEKIQKPGQVLVSEMWNSHALS